MIREQGYYWVRDRSDPVGEPVIALWDGRGWFICGADEEFGDADFVVLLDNPKLEPISTKD